jgi:hypothetical protein
MWEMLMVEHDLREGLVVQGFDSLSHSNHFLNCNSDILENSFIKELKFG